MSGLEQVNYIVAVGSVDGMAGAAATIRHLNKPDITIEFTQAHQVNFIKPDTWDSNRKVMFIDLAVNNRNVEMTCEFVRKVHDAGHEILAIADEHDSSLWAEVMGSSIHNLLIKPETRSEDLYSSCSILSKAFTDCSEELGKTMDDYTVEMLHAGDQGDRGHFDTYFGRIFNRAIKSNMGDRTRRPHLSKHLAFNKKPDCAITGWMQEYDEIEENHPKIIASRQDLGDGIFYYYANAVGRHDATSLMMSQYRNGAHVVVLDTIAFVKEPSGKGAMQSVISFGTNDKNLDLLKTLSEKQVPHLGGFSQKVNVSNEHKELALDAIRELIKA